MEKNLSMLCVGKDKILENIIVLNVIYPPPFPKTKWSMFNSETQT